MKKNFYKYSLVTPLASACALSLLAPMALAQSKDQVVEGDDGEKVYFEEVIVTAERREANVMDTPMSITAFSSEMMLNLGINDRDKLQNLVPGLQFGDTGDQEGNGTTIRGVGTSLGGIEHRDRSVATYVDGSYTIGVYGTAPGGGFDLERIEVARGPQGTLNGRNAIAGSINYVYKKPTQEWDLDIDTEVTDASQQRLNVAVGGPVTDNVSFRVTTGLHTGDGRQENVGIGGDHDKPDHKFFAGQLRFQNDRFDSNLRYSHVEDTGVPKSRVQMGNVNRTDAIIPRVANSILGNNIPGLDELGENDLETNWAYQYATPTPSGDADCAIGVPFMRCGDIKNKVALNYPGYQDSSAETINFYAQYELTDAMSLRYTYNKSDTEQLNVKDGDYMNRYADPDGDQSLASDGDGTALLRDRFYALPYSYDEESHEIMLTADITDDLSIITGLFYYENESVYGITRHENSFPLRFGSADYWAQLASPVYGFATVDSCDQFLTEYVGPVFGLPISVEDDAYFYACATGDEHTRLVYYQTQIEQNSKAVFFNGDYKINDSWGVSAGLRYLEDEKLQSAGGQVGSATFSFGGIPMTIGFSDGGFEEPHTWYGTIGQATLKYTTEEDNLIYGRLSTGHKAGQFNLVTAGSTGIPPAIDETTMVNYEVGLKGLYLDGRLQLNVAAFFQQYEGFHLTALQLGEGMQVGAQADSPLSEYTDNVDDTEIWGVEVEYAYAISDYTRVMGFYAYQDSEIGEHSSVALGDPDNQYALHEHMDLDSGDMVESWYALPKDQTGNQLPSQPKHKFAATLIHDMELASGDSLSFAGTYSYTGSMYPTIANIDLYELPSYDRWDASVRWTSTSETYSATLYVNNILDEIGLSEFVAQSGIGDQVFLGMPTNDREFGIRVSYRPQF